MISTIRQRTVVHKPVFGYYAVRVFSEDAQTPEDLPKQEDLFQYAKEGRELFVVGFGNEATQEQLEELFTPFGTLVKSKLLPSSGSLSGKYWVAFESAEIAEKVIETLGDET